MKTCFVWSLYNNVMVKDEIPNLVWIRLSVNSDLKILMNSSKYDHLELLLLKQTAFLYGKLRPHWRAAFSTGLPTNSGRIWWLQKPFLKFGPTLNTKDITKSSQCIFSLLEAAPRVFTVCCAQRPHSFIFIVKCLGMGFPIFFQTLNHFLNYTNNILNIFTYTHTVTHSHSTTLTHCFHTANGQLESHYSKE